jgi:hypothetical protein
MVPRNFTLAPAGAIAGDLIFEARQNLHQLGNRPDHLADVFLAVAGGEPCHGQNRWPPPECLHPAVQGIDGVWQQAELGQWNMVFARHRRGREGADRAILVTARRNQGSNQRFPREMRGSFQTSSPCTNKKIGSFVRRCRIKTASGSRLTWPKTKRLAFVSAAHAVPVIESRPAVDPTDFNPAEQWDRGGMIAQKQNAWRRFFAFQRKLYQIPDDPPVEILQPAYFRIGSPRRKRRCASARLLADRA